MKIYSIYKDKKNYNIYKNKNMVIFWLGGFGFYNQYLSCFKHYKNMAKFNLKMNIILNAIMAKLNLTMNIILNEYNFKCNRSNLVYFF
jgi:hypothetical protein